MTTSQILTASGILFLIIPAPAQETAAPRTDEKGIEWHDVSTWGVEGRMLPQVERARWFDRLPAAAEKKVRPPVWNLSRDSAGMMVRFKTDATSIHVSYRLMDGGLSMPHMPATGVSGVDLYARDGDGHWRWVQVTRPSSQDVEVELIKGLAPGERKYAAYLPLYNGVDRLEIGVQKGSRFLGLAPRPNPIYLKGDQLYGSDSEGATDASHANDLGFMRQAEAFLPVIRKALGE